MSWVVINRETKEAVAELYDHRNVARLNTDKYQAIPTREYLEALSARVKAATQQQENIL